MWYALLTLIRKELQALFSSPQSRGLLIMPVLLQLLLFPFAATLEVKNSTLAIYNQDGGAASIELVQRLAAAKAFPHIINLYSESEMQRVIDDQKALLAIRVPVDFSRKLARGEASDLQAVIDGRRSNSAQIAFGYAAQVVAQYAAEGMARPLPAQLVVQNLYNPNLEYRWFVLPSLVAIITTIGCLIVTALSLAREKEEGTFEQLLVSPLTPAYIMLGKAIPGILVAMLQGTVIATAAVFAYRVPFGGTIWLLYFSMLCYGLSLAGVGLLISSLCSNQQQAFLGVFGFMSPAVILSGYMAPVENMPLPLRVISAVDPLTHFIIVVKGIFLKSYDLTQAWPHLWPLLVISAVNLTIAYLIFRNRSGQ
jgi:ABC-2 type transport system permease protein